MLSPLIFCQQVPPTRGTPPHSGTMANYLVLRGNLWFAHKSQWSCVQVDDHDSRQRESIALSERSRGPWGPCRSRVRVFSALTCGPVVRKGSRTLNGSCGTKAPPCATGLIVITWNPGAKRRDKGAMAQHLAGPFHIVVGWLLAPPTANHFAALPPYDAP